ncbi:MAG: hypothetical protein ACRDQZ_00195 [Mycobacteriales bacterium]
MRFLDGSGHALPVKTEHDGFKPAVDLPVQPDYVAEIDLRWKAQSSSVGVVTPADRMYVGLSATTTTSAPQRSRKVSAIESHWRRKPAMRQ